MIDNANINLKQLEGRSFIIGREGHIYIDSRSASKNHAELKITNGRIYLRDLDSSNGTYLVKNGKMVYFERGFVSPLQQVVIGKQKYTIQQLLEIAGNFAVSDDSPTEIDIDDIDDIDDIAV